MRFRIAAEIAGPAIRQVAVALLSLLLAADAAFAQQAAKPKTSAAVSDRPAKPSAVDSRKCVGVISTIGHRFAVQAIGVTVFGNELNYVPIDSWQIDDLVVRKISTFLSKSWAVRRINYPNEVFSSLTEPHGLFLTTRGSFRELSAG
jgi:hypothetical protein